MEYKRYKLGDLITQRREKYEGDDIPIAGISKNGFMPPKQIEADTSIYNVFYLNDFVFNPARMELNSIVFNDVYPKAICSSLYEMFYVHRTDVIMPEYLNLYVKRDEFARHCEFLGSGSAREYCRVANISEIKLDIPSLEEQQKIVRQYKTITDRIEVLEKINEELTKLAKIAIEEGLQEDVTDVLISEFCKDTSSGGTPSRSHSEYYGGSINWLKSGEVHNNIVVEVEEQITQKGLEKSSAKLFPKDTVLMAMYGVTAGQVGYLNVESTTNQAICAMLCKNEYDSAFLYFSLLIKQEEFERQATGGAQQNLSQDIIKNNTIKISHKYRDLHCDVFMGNIIYNSIEIAKLNRIKESIAQRL